MVTSVVTYEVTCVVMTCVVMIYVVNESFVVTCGALEVEVEF